MKRIDTGYYQNKAEWDEVRSIIEELFTEDSENWLCLYDTSKKNPNYIQTHSELIVGEEEALEFLHNNLQYTHEQINNVENIYLIEYRHYADDNTFKHFRAYFPKATDVVSYFERYYNDEPISVEGYWLDVTYQFLKD